jgi:hypothetical protein
MYVLHRSACAINHASKLNIWLAPSYVTEPSIQNMMVKLIGAAKHCMDTIAPKVIVMKVLR